MSFNIKSEVIDFEEVLRDFIAEVLGLNEESWIKKNLGEEELIKIKKRAKSGALKDQISLGQSRQIIEKEWENFKVVFDSKQRTLCFLDVISETRNKLLHSKPLIANEEHTAYGLMHRIRTQMAIHRSKDDPSHEMYPSFVKANDSFGRKINFVRNQTTTDETMRVKVGDKVIFRITADDPKGRNLNYKFQSRHGKVYALFTDVPSGEEVRTTWEVGKEDVQEKADVRVYIESSGKYHRNKHYDDLAVFRFAVDAPE